MRHLGRVELSGKRPLTDGLGESNRGFTLIELLVFIDENEHTLMDSQFGMPTDHYNGTQTWWDMPANRHNQGANLCFADGHAERWKWVAPKVFNSWMQGVTPDEMPDWLRIKACIKQTMD
jgi:prepilin-type processing-associated H-X9-DG protein